MRGFQAEGAAPLVTGEPFPHPETKATAIRVGNPASWQQALAARDESGGDIQAVTDRQILQAYRLLAQREGVFVEPASAASVAGLLQASQGGLVERGERVVCTVTGNGLKDPDTAIGTIHIRRAYADISFSTSTSLVPVALPTSRAYRTASRKIGDTVGSPPENWTLICRRGLMLTASSSSPLTSSSVRQAAAAAVGGSVRLADGPDRHLARGARIEISQCGGPLDPDATRVIGSSVTSGRTQAELGPSAGIARNSR
mgnify:CR=1 FL=1